MARTVKLNVLTFTKNTLTNFLLKAKHTTATALTKNWKKNVKL